MPEDVNFDDLVQDTKMFLYVMGYNKDSPMNISTQRLFRLQHLLDIHNKSFEEAMYQVRVQQSTKSILHYKVGK